MAKRFGSVRARVTLGALLVVAATLALVGIGIVRLIATTMVGDAETAAEIQAKNLSIVAEAGRLHPVLDVDAAGTTILQVVTSDGEVVAASVQLAGMPRLGSAIPLPGETIPSTVRVLQAGGSEVDYRVVAVGTESPHGPVAVFAGVSLAEAELVLSSLTRLLLFGFAAVLLVMGGVSWVVIAHALRPVDAIRTEVDRLANGDLSRRVPVPAHQDEIHHLAITMNRMLARVQAAADRERAFIGDASHELRSPIASLRTQLEVTAAHPEGMEVEEVVTEALADVTRLESLTSDLLVLARLDAHQAPDAHSFDLAELVGAILQLRRGDRVPVEYQQSETVTAFAAPQQVSQVVTNLVDNAVRHASNRVVVEVHGPTVPGGLAEVTVVDDGPGIPVQDQERIFERFVRLDSVRSRQEGGTGLGLSIARELARANGGDVVVAASQHGATLCLTVPAAAVTD